MKHIKFYIGCTFIGASIAMLILDHIHDLSQLEGNDLHSIFALITAIIFFVLDKVEGSK